MSKKLKITRTRDVKLPSRGTKGSAGIDFFVPNDFPDFGVDLSPGKGVLIPSGIRMKIPKGYALVFKNKSGVATKKELYVGACVVDEDYQGEVHLHVINVGAEMQTVNAGEKLVQALLVKVPKISIKEVPEDMLFDSETERAGGGFGSTGID